MAGSQLGGQDRGSGNAPRPPGSESPASVIRTPDQRLRVFVSSTLQEVAEERAAARQAITRLRLTPVMFELGARPHPPQELYRAYLEQSDIFVGIYWERYGWVAPDMEISGLEDEFRLSGQRPKLIYVKSPAPNREPRLQELLNQLQNENSTSYKPFSSAAELQELIENDLATLLTERFATSQAAESTERPQRPTNLPALTTPLIGRDQELAAIAQLLLQNDVRLVTLTGPGGSGKTRLSLQIAANLLAHFPNGVYFVGLELARDPAAVIAAISQVLAIREAGAGSPLETLQDAVRDKHLLLVLDNFEQVLPAAPVVATLLATAPRLKVIVTSQAALNLSGEHEFPIRPLVVPDRNPAGNIQPNVSLLGQNPAVALFVQRAQAVHPNFALTEDNAPAVAEICARLDGLPLAIELAATRTRLLPPQAILERLDSRLKLLTGGAQDRPDRQKTMRGAITWSYDLLSPNEQTLFRRLAVFAGGFTLEAAEAIANTPDDFDILDSLASLVSKSLLGQNQPDGAEPRFAMLELIREYALEQLAQSGEAPAIQRQHALFFLKLAETADPHLLSAAREGWLHRLDAEHDNLLAALDWSHEQPNQGEIELRLAGALHWYWYFRGYLSEGIRRLEDALARPASQEQQPLRARVLYAAGGLAWLQSNYELAHTRTQESVSVWRTVGDKRGLAFSLALLGLVELVSGQAEPALSLSQESVALFRELADAEGLALALYTLGFVTSARGDDDAARSILEESAALFRDLGDPWGLALPLSSLGDIAARQGESSTAQAYLQESAASFRQTGDKRGLARTLTILGELAQRQGDTGRARALFEESLSLRRELGGRGGIAWSVGKLAQVAYEQHDYLVAQANFAQALRQYRDVDDRPGMADCLAGLAGVAAAQGQPQRAAQFWGAAKALGTAISAAMRAAIQPQIDAIRAQDPAQFDIARQAGQAMTIEQVISLVQGSA